MAYPVQDLVDRLDAGGELTDWNIYQTPTPGIVPPALVIRPDDPWVEPSDYCHDLQRYAAIGVVQAASPESGVMELYDLWSAVIDAIQAEDTPWSWRSVGQPVIDESTGTAFLAATIRLEYRNSG